MIVLNAFELFKQSKISSECSKAFDQSLLQLNNEIDNDLIILKPLLINYIIITHMFECNTITPNTSTVK